MAEVEAAPNTSPVVTHSPPSHTTTPHNQQDQNNHVKLSDIPQRPSFSSVSSFDDSESSPSSPKRLHKNSSSSLSIDAESSVDTTDDEYEEEEAPAFPSRAAELLDLTDSFTIGAMLAIRTAVLAKGAEDELRKSVTIEDFGETREHRLSMAGDKKLQVKDYAPVAFAHIRKHFGITVYRYLMSWSDSRLSRSKTEGKSDATFMLSPDRKFIIKTVTKGESARLRKLLPSYFQHIRANPETFLSRLLGLHRVNRRMGQAKIYFVVLNNVFNTPAPLTEVYDLKGSTVGRRTSEEAKLKSKTVVLKDLDLTRTLSVPVGDKNKVIAQAETDCRFLAKHQMMDYSLLIGVCREEVTPSPAHSPISARGGRHDGSSNGDASPSLRRPRLGSTSGISSTSSGMSDGLKRRRTSKVPGLLFFIESTKQEKPEHKKKGQDDEWDEDDGKEKKVEREKQNRRKSVNMGKAQFATKEMLEEEEEDEEQDRLDQATNENTTANGYSPSTPAPAPLPASPRPLASSSTTTTTTTATTATSSVSSANSSFSPSLVSSPSSSSVDAYDSPGETKREHILAELLNEVAEIPEVEVDSVACSPTIESLALESKSLQGSPNKSSLRIALSPIERTSSSSKFRPVKQNSLTCYTPPPSDVPVPFHQKNDGGLRSPILDNKESNTQFRETYYIGIIDFLQKYNKKKKLAGFAKSLRYDKGELSTVEPSFYMTRFMGMVKKVIQEPAA
eukprot:TRINITY_DN3223_c0_g1_i1.p1 TRINITY_DN3223_c0_g1~~TRINITY_DN3223_c0_g1_i1.p1  ORF type:complete len:730 (-),score=223.28 TRINITY_DN3223_c0_g1_i1:92-2281(-)